MAAPASTGEAALPGATGDTAAADDRVAAAAPSGVAAPHAAGSGRTGVFAPPAGRAPTREPWVPELTPEPAAFGDPLRVAVQQVTGTGWKARLDGGPLGPLSVQVDLRHAVVSAQFEAGAQAAPLLQQTAHQLAERLAGQGLSLGQFSVNGEAGRGTGAEGNGRSAHDYGDGPRVGEAAPASRGGRAPVALAYAGVAAAGGPRQWRM